MGAVSIARKLEQFAICVGADIMELREVWGVIKNAHIDNNLYQEEKYSETCRSDSCSQLILLDRVGKRCKSCAKLLRILRGRIHSLLSQTPSSSTPNIF